MNDGMAGGEALGIVGLLIVGLISAISLGLYVWSIIWAYGDAEKRGKSGCLVALLVGLVSWPVGLIIWLVARPEGNR